MNALSGLARPSNFSHWDVGNSIAEILRGELWRSRTDDNGRSKYDSFDSFARDELKMSGKYARALSTIAARFSREAIEKFGVTKLVQLLRFRWKTNEELASMMESKAFADCSASDLFSLRKKKREEMGSQQSRRPGGRKRTGTVVDVPGGRLKIGITLPDKTRAWSTLPVGTSKDAARAKAAAWSERAERENLTSGGGTTSTEASLLEAYRELRAAQKDVEEAQKKIAEAQEKVEGARHRIFELVGSP